MPRKKADQLDEYRRRRDFARTAEPSGGETTSKPRRGAPRLAFVIQKHAASRLHFDLRLELDGVMKSWAVPKGPSLDPSVKRLAMQVEDHPIEYNQFEGTIAKGEYGGGTVMIWDRGTYTWGGEDDGGDPIAALRRGYAGGDYKFTLDGKRLHGSWVLVRMHRRDDDRQWLLIKHRDEFATADVDVVAEYQTSVVSNRTMEQIANGASRVWKSNRTPAGKNTAAGTAKKPAARTAARKPAGGRKTAKTAKTARAASARRQ